MYPTMQLRPLPGGYRAESAAADFSEPGFYSVDFEYDGDCKAPRLPVRSEGGGVVYSRRGCGTF